MAFVIDGAFERIPVLPGRSHPVHAALIMEGHLIPKGPSRSQAMVPGNMMKPEQEFFRTGGELLETVAHRIVVLRDGVAPRSRAIETNSVSVGAMKIDRVPVFALFRVPPRRRPIMMTAPEEVMQSQRRHVINYGFVRLKHDGGNRLARPSIVRHVLGIPSSRV